jgi:hypothetical protein
MLLGRTKEARNGYLAHPGKQIEVASGKLWQKVIIDEFEKLRANGRKDPLMDEIENSFKDLAAKAAK